MDLFRFVPVRYGRVAVDLHCMAERHKSLFMEVVIRLINQYTDNWYYSADLFGTDFYFN